MLILVSGADSSGISNFIKSKKSNYNDSNTFTFEAGSFKLMDIKDLVFANSLLPSDGKLLILRPKKVSEVDFKDNFLEAIKDNKHVEVVIDVSKLNKTTNVYKKLVKVVKPTAFNPPKDFSGF